ncbi:hypothetical protein B0H63DRAFT_463559, partial [Podospora didyma]
MDKTKQALKDVAAKAGHHDTTVHEQTAPAVKQETIKPTRHEEINTAVNKEVHQDHYHRTVQPVFDKQVLPETHRHNVQDTEHREFDHRDNEGTKRQLATEAGQLRDERHVAGTTHTQSRAPVIQGENVHHHVHETIQPVLHKETIQPEVVHTTVPIHEVHHEKATHHGTTTLPPVNVNDYQKQGGSLQGGKERFDEFEGCHKGLHREGCGHAEGAGNTMSGTTGTSSTTTSSSNTRQHGLGSTHEEKHKKPSLMDRLNPMTDADGDGKKGFM